MGRRQPSQSSWREQRSHERHDLAHCGTRLLEMGLHEVGLVSDRLKQPTRTHDHDCHDNDNRTNSNQTDARTEPKAAPTTTTAHYSIISQQVYPQEYQKHQQATTNSAPKTLFKVSVHFTNSLCMLRPSRQTGTARQVHTSLISKSRF